VEQSVIDDAIDDAANRETELRIVGHDVFLVCVKRLKLYKMRLRVNVVLFTSALSYLPKLYLTTDVLQVLLLFVDICACNEPPTTPLSARWTSTAGQERYHNHQQHHIRGIKDNGSYRERHQREARSRDNLRVSLYCNRPNRWFVPIPVVILPNAFVESRISVH